VYFITFKIIAQECQDTRIQTFDGPYIVCERIKHFFLVCIYLNTVILLSFTLPCNQRTAIVRITDRHFNSKNLQKEFSLYVYFYLCSNADLDYTIKKYLSLLLSSFTSYKFHSCFSSKNKTKEKEKKSPVILTDISYPPTFVAKMDTISQGSL